jgi:hypothetical protein
MFLPGTAWVGGVAFGFRENCFTLIVAIVSQVSRSTLDTFSDLHRWPPWIGLIGFHCTTGKVAAHGKERGRLN